MYDIGYIVIFILLIELLLNCGNFVSDPAEPPQSVQVIDVRHDCVKLSWKPPAFDGGSPVTSYIVEMRDKLQTSYVY